MAAAQNALNANTLQNLQARNDSLDLADDFISGTPYVEYHNDKLKWDAKLGEKRVNGMSGIDICQGTAPGGRNYVGPNVAGAVQAVFNSASQSMYSLMVQKVKHNSALFSELAKQPFLNDAEYTYVYINHYMQAGASPEDIHKFNVGWDGTTFMNSIKKVSKSSQYEWRDHLVNMNHRVPPAMRKNPREIARKFASGNHKAISNMCMDRFDAMPATILFPANYPALLFPGGPAHPNAGQAHPQAGEVDMNAFVLAVNPRWEQLIASGVVHVNNVVTDVRHVEDGFLVGVTTPEGQHFEVGSSYSDSFSITDLVEYGYSATQVRNINRGSKFPRCFACGGLNHMAMKDGVYQCATPRDSVPKEVLFKIRYPAEVLQPRARGKGRGGRGRGRGRGAISEAVNAALEELLISAETDEVPPTEQPQQQESAKEEKQEEKATVQEEFSVEDFFFANAICDLGRG